jgi:nucleotide-binding universal stress UspA family protein
MNNMQSCPVSGLRTILLATDGTEYSEGAVRETINFAKQCSTKIYAISVVESMTDYEGFSAQQAEESFEGKAKESLEKLKARAEKEGAVCETILASGEPYKCIVEAAEAKNVDMIVVGRRGAKGLTKLLLGEVAANISYQNILVATDGSSNSEAAVTAAIEIAKQCDSKVIALSSIRTIYEQENATANVNKAVELGKKEGVAVEGLTPMGRSYEAIVEAAGGRGVDLIVLGTYGKTGLTRMLMGSSTERVIGLAGCAVMVVKGDGGKAATV